jgi:hypothetical protein
MGISIYYSGRLKSPRFVDALVKEAADACMCVGWRFEYLKQSNIMPMSGIIITPEWSEPIMLTFTEDGLLANPARFMLWENPETLEVSIEKDGVCFAKTHYAGADMHIAIVKFMRYIIEKYFSEHKFFDDSGYWNDKKEDKCRYRFGEMERALNEMADALGPEDDDSYEERVEEWIKERVRVN